jgi:hypothetical protein
MVALSICVFTVVKIYNAPAESPVSQLTPANASVSSNGSSDGQPPALPELSAETRQQLQTPTQSAPSAALPGAQPAPGKVNDSRSPDDTSPESHASNGKPSQNSRSHNTASPNVSPQSPSPRGSLARPPNAQLSSPGRTATTPGAAQRPGATAGRAAQDANQPQDPNRLDATEDPETAAPAEGPDVIYIPETPQERDARMRRELADSVCDQYGVQRDACRAKTAKH